MNPILREAVAKARASLRPPWKNRPGAWIDADATERAALRRAERYERFAEAPGKRPAGGKARIAIARAEAKRHREAMTGKEFRDFARGFDTPRQFDQADGREAMERDRAKAKAAARRRNDKNNDGWTDGQRPKGAKPRKTATERLMGPNASKAMQAGRKDEPARSAVQGATAKEVASRGAKVKQERKPSNFRIDESGRDPDGLYPRSRAYVERVRRSKGDAAAEKAAETERSVRAAHHKPNKNWAADTASMQAAMQTRKPGAPQKSQWYSPEHPIAGVQTGFVTGRTLNTPDREAYSRGAADGASGKPLNTKGLTGNALYSYERAWATARAKNKISKAIRDAIRKMLVQSFDRRLAA